MVKLRKEISYAITLVMIITAVPMADGNTGRIEASPGPAGGLADSPWPMFRQNLNHTGLSPHDTSGNKGNLRWSFKTDHIIESSPAIGSNGAIYVGSADNYTYAINPDGSQKWRLWTGTVYQSSPAIDSDGTIYIGSIGFIGQNDSGLYAINPDGTEKWIVENLGIRTSPVIGSDGMIYVGSCDGGLYAINPNGTERWSFGTQAHIHSSPAIGSDGSIYVGSRDSELYAINPDGSEKWSLSVGSGASPPYAYGVDYSSPAIGSDGTIYIGSHSNNLDAVNPNGTRKWRFMTGGRVETSPAIGSDGTIYIGSYDNRVYAINADGTEKWNFTTNGYVESSPAIGSDGTIFVGSNDNRIYAINPDGTEKWNFMTGDSVVSSPAIGSDAMIYVGSHDGRLYAIGNPVTQKPVADAGPDQTVNEGDTVQFNGTGSRAAEGGIVLLGPNIKVNDVDATGGVGGVPQVVLDENGTAYLTWKEGRTGLDIYFDKAPRRGDFGTDIRVDDGKPRDWASNQGIALGAEGEIHVAWYAETGTRYSVSTDNGTTFSSSIEISDENTPYGYPVRIATGSDASVNVVWGSLGRVCYRSSPDGGANWDPGSIVANGTSPDVAVAEDNSVYVVWQGVMEGSKKPTILLSLKSLGGSFEPAVPVHSPDNWARYYPSIAIGQDGEILITWVEYGSGEFRIAFAKSLDGGSSFEPSIIVRSVWPAVAPHVVRLDRPAVTVFGSTGVGVAWVENQQPFQWEYETRVSVSLDRGETFSPYRRVDDDPSKSFKRLAAIAGNAHGDLFAAWHDFRDDLPESQSTSTIYGVWLDVSSAPSSLIYEWDFDASVDSDGDGNNANDKEGTGPTPTHTYHDDGIYIVTLTVTDSEGLQDTDQCSITVLNVPPTPKWTSRSVDGTILKPPYPEGKEILFEATVYDPGIYDTFTYDWDFGDGTIRLDAGPSVVHAYGDNDTYIVVLKVTDDDGGVGIDDTPPLLSTNEDPVASISIPRCPYFEGGPACPIDGFFTDPGWLDTHSAVWDFGDGEYETAVITEENEPPDATGMSSTSHVYGDNGAYNVTFTVVDDDGGSHTALAWVSPYNLSPSISIDIPSSVNEGELFNLGIIATDPGSDDLFIDISWGDGTFESATHYNNGVGPDPPNSGPGVFPFTIHANFSQVYGDDGNFTISLNVSDDDGGYVVYETYVLVLNVAPTITATNYTVFANEPRTVGYWGHQCEVEQPYGDHTGILPEWVSDISSQSQVFSWISTEEEVCDIVQDGNAEDMIVMAKRQLMGVWLNLVSGKLAPSTPIDMPSLTSSGTVWEAVLEIEDVILNSQDRYELERVKNIADNINNGIGIAVALVEFTATATDPGADDLTFSWD
ncbi:MAG: PQQ-binding-like beta-propeller repeat protein, partial [Methanobacteriota archaeon]